MGKHILIIDDNKVVLTRIQDDLESAGYKVSTSEDGIRCHDIIYSIPPPDLILMDVKMPYVTGDRLTQLIKDRPHSSHIPVVLISSMARQQLKALAVECGADAFMVKPFDEHDLIVKIEKLLSVDQRV